METSPQPLKSILIFGAAAHIGLPLTTYLTKNAPDIHLRLISTNPSRRSLLVQKFPNAEIVHADFHDPASLTPALKDIEGVFIITPSGTLEETPTKILIAAMKDAGTIKHVVRFVGVFPEISSRCYEGLPEGTLPKQHTLAKKLLEESGLPVTFVNSGATFMDNLFLQIRSVHNTKARDGKPMLIWPHHRVPFLDPRDIAEVVGKIFLLPPEQREKHIGAFHTLNNGQDFIDFRELASILSEVLYPGEEAMGYDGTEKRFKDFYTPFMGPKAVENIWKFFEYEDRYDVIWSLNDFVERMIGRKPKSVREWVEEHKGALLAVGEAMQKGPPQGQLGGSGLNK